MCIIFLKQAANKQYICTYIYIYICEHIRNVPVSANNKIEHIYIWYPPRWSKGQSLLVLLGAFLQPGWSTCGSRYHKSKLQCLDIFAYWIHMNLRRILHSTAGLPYDYYRCNHLELPAQVLRQWASNGYRRYRSPGDSMRCLIIFPPAASFWIWWTQKHKPKLRSYELLRYAPTQSSTPSRKMK